MAEKRDGAGDAALLAAAHLHELRQLPYAELDRRVGGGWVDEQVEGLSGIRYRRRTRVLSSGDRLHIRILIDDGTRMGALRPLAEEIVHVLPDGHFLRERPAAHERRFEYPTRWFRIVIVILCVLMIVVFLLQ